MKERRRGRAEGGFSLVELLVVITIIGILATTVTVKVISVMSQARTTKAKAEISEIKKAADMYRIQHGRHAESLEDLRQPSEKNGGEAYIDIRKDPWGNEYYFERQGRKVLIYSLGADNLHGGEGEDADIDSDNLGEGPSGDPGGSSGGTPAGK
jgi:general secretion pathway protein G